MNQINNNSFILFLSKIYISLLDMLTTFYKNFYFYFRIEWYTIFHPVLYHSSLNPKKNLNYGKWHVWGQLLLLDQVSIRMRPPQAAVINVTVSTLNRQLEKVIPFTHYLTEPTFFNQITSKKLSLCLWEITKKTLCWKGIKIFHFSTLWIWKFGIFD